MQSQDDLLDLVGRIYDAAIDPSLWPDVLSALCDATGSAGVNFMIVDKASGLIPRSVSVGIPSDRVDEYNYHVVKFDPRVKYGFENPQKKIIYDYQFTNESEMDRSEYYNWLNMLGGFRYFLAARVLENQDVTAFVSLQRLARDGHADQPAIDRFQRLASHLSRAAEIGLRFDDLHLRTGALGDAMDSPRFGIILLDEQGAVLQANRAADEVIAASDGLRGGLDGVRAVRPHDDAALQRLIGEAIRTGLGIGLGAGGAIAIPRPSGKRPYQVMVSPLPVRESLFALRRPAAVVFVTDPEHADELPEATLRRLFGLSKREAAVAALMATGMTIERAADALGVTRNTARNALQSVYRKTGTRRQSELVRLLLRSPAGLAPGT